MLGMVFLGSRFICQFCFLFCLHIIWYFKTYEVILWWKNIHHFYIIVSQESGIYIGNTLSSTSFQLLVYMHILKGKMNYLKYSLALLFSLIISTSQSYCITITTIEFLLSTQHRSPSCSTSQIHALSSVIFCIGTKLQCSIIWEYYQLLS